MKTSLRPVGNTLEYRILSQRQLEVSKAQIGAMTSDVAQMPFVKQLAAGGKSDNGPALGRDAMILVHALHLPYMEYIMAGNSFDPLLHGGVGSKPCSQENLPLPSFSKILKC